MKRIMFTGGGSAGHVSVNLALIPYFIKEGWSVDYVGSHRGIERELVTKIEGINYFAISTGKLRRYLDINNIKDSYKVIKGVLDAYLLIKRRKPEILFSKGGFVSVPVVLGAWLNKVPIVIHESDITPGLANKISFPFAKVVCTTFPHLKELKNSHKVEFIGPVIREEILNGNAERGRKFCGFDKSKPIVLVIGGSLGSRTINQTTRLALHRLLERFRVIHICGKGQIDTMFSSPFYRQYEYLSKELPDIIAMSDIIVSRAGANSIFEFLYHCKPMLLIPLTKAQSRGDQILNARYFQASGYCEILYEEQLSEKSLFENVMKLYNNRNLYKKNMAYPKNNNATSLLLELIKNVSRAY
ncbi:undecaprenyldiphospho-muramoylpentapeptide beta-N-acetylglucosaminyltransferase [Paenibacillus macerans]|uniref:UDP-N-acetylglucosamine--N-acetylmuramyl-(pentapeptide) pyrophosphoryl-undecaprenol N-acetylglucosamine transferase n=1 Tax=Paenibacillus macerans TaxID=44252 RepID=A0A091A4N5_PAEMA|nr:undecaprenyldiphospho-muramoylpentapeptide beta-N-acetylglucosaminyltransferase [Paenibacillus macerans]KFN11261.1 hypothetical protein DJ90_2529 [Paenibacillus macerans]MCY7560214.1 undecaprenyldiphospho-muramoylpentapeptide beta-N-acetylglucosaminyltransferase [Paenibacillus macerans]MEC0151268.1 undecaprenyldiphospho-muramoylpentapeptide beta-N-acetylglucosaminyltransferase [Paenibacillus macerans]SUD26829.1 UDP-N-acetylglucosamine--N-acetylmuramyl-(pentapeptide) pyrophosphoryl-UDP N- ace